MRLRRAALYGLGLCGLAAIVFSSPLWLEAAARRLLVADDPDAPVSHLWLHSRNGFFVEGDRVCEIAADICRRQPGTKILLTQSAPGRLVTDGIVPSPETIARKQLLEHGARPEAIVTVPGQGHHLWDDCRNLQAWLRQNPEARVCLFSDRFNSRNDLAIVNKVLGGDADKVVVQGLPDREIDQRNWWRSRPGVKGFMFALLERFYTASRGERAWQRHPWDEGGYEQWLRTLVKEGGR